MTRGGERLEGAGSRVGCSRWGATPGTDAALVARRGRGAAQPRGPVRRVRSRSRSGAGLRLLRRCPQALDADLGLVRDGGRSQLLLRRPPGRCSGGSRGSRRTGLRSMA
eukprot:1332844-Heterocapsa_arctica.AAC.2